MLAEPSQDIDRDCVDLGGCGVVDGVEVETVDHHHQAGVTLTTPADLSPHATHGREEDADVGSDSEELRVRSRDTFYPDVHLDTLFFKCERKN